MAAKRNKTPLGDLASVAVPTDGVIYPSDTSTPALAMVLADPVSGDPVGTATNPLVVTGSASGSNQVQGVGASDATAVGNPVLTAGLANQTPAGGAAAATGQTKSLWVTAQGAIVIGGAGVALTDAVSNAQAATLAKPGSSNTISVFPVANFDFNGAAWDRHKKPSAVSRIVSSAATTNATSAKASAGDLFKIYGQNMKAAPVYLKLYNKASAPTVGTDIPFMTIPLAATAIFNLTMDSTYFSAGIAYAFTTGSADSDTTALAAGDIVGFNLSYS